MADITMCSTFDCPLAKDCYRKNAVSNPYYQSYSKFMYVKNNKGNVECTNYWPIKSKTKKLWQVIKK